MWAQNIYIYMFMCFTLTSTGLFCTLIGWIFCLFAMLSHPSLVIWKALVHWILQIFWILAQFILKYQKFVFVNNITNLIRKSLSIEKLSSSCLRTQIFSLATNTVSRLLEVSGALDLFSRKGLQNVYQSLKNYSSSVSCCFN